MTFSHFYRLYTEAISLTNASKHNLTRKKGGGYKIDVLNKVFNGKDRLVLDLELKEQRKPEDSAIYILVKQELMRNAYLDINSLSHEDYIAGIVYASRDTHKQQPQRIGKLLRKMMSYPDNSEYEKEALKNLADAFRDDPDRSASKSKSSGAAYKIVISRHPYDIAGMSTDRNWTSCMDLGLPHIEYTDKENRIEPGVFHDTIPHDIRLGTIVAYLVASSDIHKNGKMAIRRPLSRISLKPVKSIEDASQYKYSVGAMYGVKVSEFRQKVTDWVIHNINGDYDGGLYFTHPSVYTEDDDTYPNIKIVNLQAHTRPDILEKCKLDMHPSDIGIYPDRIGLYFAVDERLPETSVSSDSDSSRESMIRTRFTYPILEMLGIGISPDTPRLSVRTSDTMLEITIPIGPPSYKNADYSAKEYVDDLVHRISTVLPNGVDSDKFQKDIVKELDDPDGKFGNILELEILSAWASTIDHIAETNTGDILYDDGILDTFKVLQQAVAGSSTPLETLNDVLLEHADSISISQSPIITACIRWVGYNVKFATLADLLSSHAPSLTDHPYRHVWDQKQKQLINSRWAVISAFSKYIAKHQDIRSWKTYVGTHRISGSLEAALQQYLPDYAI